ncbi:FAD-dependent oxidoreductase [Bradyrhizobium sp. WSM1417]|uniref:FAD-dependent oxidoreductase n=1 Tax=Bradyrhizobium sp. WSM1417 TaxID=754500 RepID=UPI0004B72975|nr:FAD-dependent oxidoreductase [Bradyrhizobium sp. WSM1417]
MFELVDGGGYTKLNKISDIYDVIVVGGGGSGLAAALSAASSGAKTLLLEKNGAIGGSTAMSIGSITAAGTRFQKDRGVVDTTDSHFIDMGLFLGADDHRENKELRRILVDNVPDTLEWLMGLGLRFFGPMPEPPHSKPRMHNVIPNSRAYPYVLSRACFKSGVQCLTNARVTELLKDGDAVTGVIVSVAGVQRHIKCRGGVILATGDFSASPAFKERFLPSVAHIDAINPSCTGDGQRIGEGIGAPILNGDILWGPSLRVQPGEGTSLAQRLPAWPLLTKVMSIALAKLPVWLFRPFVLSFMTSTLAPSGKLLRAGAILINRDGRRFTSEADNPALDVAKQTGNQAYIVFDEEIAQKFTRWPNYVSTAPGVAYAYIGDYQKQNKLYAQGKSVAELASRIGVPSERLSETFRTYNEELKTRSDETRKPLDRGPFHAIGPVSAWIDITEGGLGVSSKHEVLTAQGQIIPGMYAVGSVGQGGLILAGHGHHLGWAFTSGRRAATFAAERARNLSEQ